MKTSELREMVSAASVGHELAEEVIRLREALAKVAQHLPTDTDLADAGYDNHFIDAACSAYEAARALLTEHDE